MASSPPRLPKGRRPAPVDHSSSSNNNSRPPRGFLCHITLALTAALVMAATLLACSMSLVVVPPPPHALVLLRDAPRGADDGSIVPAPCRLWPGEDASVEGNFYGYHVLLRAQKDVQAATVHRVATAMPALRVTPPQGSTTTRILCVWRMDARVDLALALDYWMHSCHRLWIAVDDYAKASATNVLPPAWRNRAAIQLWASDNLPSWTSVPKEMDWLVVLPPETFVIFELLLPVLESVTAGQATDAQPWAIPGGILSEPTRGKPHLRKPEAYCPAGVWNRAAVRQSWPKSSSSAGSMSDNWVAALVQTLQAPASGVTCAAPTDNLPWTHVNMTDYTSVAQWRRLHAILQGTCDVYWQRPLGALDAHGRPGYVHDPTALRRLHAPSLNRSLSHCETEGPWFEATRRALSKVVVAPPHPATRDRPPRVLCMVYTHSNRHAQMRAIAETWGPHCDGFMAASNHTDPTLGTVHLLHEGPEMYQNMWLKVRAMWEYAYQHYRDDYDFFHIGGDDHVVIPANLRWMASTGSIKGPWDHSTPLYLGGSLAVGPQRRYCGGGSGYTLNRVALDLLLTELWWDISCFPHWQGPEEDISISRCFRTRRLQCMDTNDELAETRYHPWDAAYHASWTNKQVANWAPKMLTRQGIVSSDGMGQISNVSVAFHLKQLRPNPALPPDSGMRLYHAVMYGFCDDDADQGT